MKIVIKVGTQSILSSDGTPFEPIMLHLVEQIVALQKASHQVVLVSSGAVASGRKVASQFLGRQYGSSIGEKQVLASLGQYELMHVYASMLKEHNMLASQLLLTKQDFQTRQHYLNISRLLHEILGNKKIVPIINENDSVAIEELMFTDNDELSGLIAAMINADKLIILSNVEGVYTKHPNETGSELISTIDPKSTWPEVSAIKSLHGRGGMISKLGTARKMSNLGITTHIASINHSSVIMRILNDEALGTTILPTKKRSNIKRWIAYSEKKTGSITINSCLVKIIKENKRIISILPVGIEKFSGEFKRGDLIEILTPDNEKIGIGLAKYDAIKLNEYLGHSSKPEFIHYDHLHIF
ncbi:MULTISPECIES: glutamate 5-kinase [Legionella]|uniref:Glutamate 5-kinase n=1 Tax=Legionella resiliens TaxID=2905958 RepID=A0ABS8X5S1_9GAMM|nr:MULTISPECIES: glutamate 5-kinase [unclassified Legionella]MCE0723785.1 glutamate 5-kinase [Legionella sp. 9fVS26]MCE3532937.1 glutamate 5-kinase [Legionella sp. 8cVS16]QLZ69126.1 glutamate 5-kinase [Legionella sp. PC1000]